MRLIDLHTHTTASDGTDSPADLVAGARAAGLAAVAITDHDTVSGLPEAVAAGERLGMEVIPGCELAVSTPLGEAHVVGLWLPANAPRFTAALAAIREKRDERNKETIAMFRRAGYDVAYEDLLNEAGGESVGRVHMARLLVRKGICSSPHEAFSRFLADGKAMYVPREVPSPEQGFSLLHNEGATVVFAHPMLFRAPVEKIEALVRSFKELGLDAIEAYHADHDAKAVRRVEAWAGRYGLALSGGSDYHGAVRPGTRLGAGTGSLKIPYELLDTLRALRQKKGLPV